MIQASQWFTEQEEEYQFIIFEADPPNGPPVRDPLRRTDSDADMSAPQPYDSK